MTLIFTLFAVGAVFMILSYLSFKSDKGETEQYIGTVFSGVLAVPGLVCIFMSIFGLLVKMFQQF